MFARLVESGRRPRRSGSGTVMSVLFHFVLVSAAVVGTTRGEPVLPAEPADRIAYVAPPAPSNPEPAAAVRGSSGGGARPVAAPPVVFSPDQLDIPVVVGAPIPGPVIPNVGPDMDALYDALLTGTAVGGGGTGAVSDAAWNAVMVEEVAVPSDRNPAPPYPAMERSAGITGEVIARFVVDTSGRVEAGSEELLSVTTASFGRSVLQVLPRYRFTPARVQGRAVRQLVEQRFVFRLD